MVHRDAIFVTAMETIRAAPQNQLHLKSTGANYLLNWYVWNH